MALALSRAVGRKVENVDTTIRRREPRQATITCLGLQECKTERFPSFTKVGVGRQYSEKMHGEIMLHKLLLSVQIISLRASEDNGGAAVRTAARAVGAQRPHDYSARRNDPCPRGSGRKYKNSFGQQPANWEPRTHCVKHNLNHETQAMGNAITGDKAQSLRAAPESSYVVGQVHSGTSAPYGLGSITLPMVLKGLLLYLRNPA